ncbi:MAG: DUF6353 family protein [Clostridia bacterium]
MNKMELMTAAAKSFNKMSFTLKKYSPEIFVVVGVIGTVASAVLACRATTKISEILDKTKEDLDQIHSANEEDAMVESHTPEMAKKDLALVYVQTGVKLVKLYAPSVILGTLSVASILTSHNILGKRNAALAAAFATVNTGFQEYRNRVVERYGETADYELKHNIRQQKIEEVVTDENGKQKKVKKTVSVTDVPDTESDYSRIFAEGYTLCWDDFDGYNESLINAQQNYANDILVSRGHIFLNEVYDMLGFEHSKAGQIVGWVYNIHEPNGDNYVQFIKKEVYIPEEIDGETTYRPVTLIDFNVDGNILDLIQ